MIVTYTPFDWVNRVVEFPRRYELTLVAGTTYDLTREPGVITFAGTRVNETRMNHIEAGVLRANVAHVKLRLGGLPT